MNGTWTTAPAAAAPSCSPPGGRSPARPAGWPRSVLSRRSPGPSPRGRTLAGPLVTELAHDGDAAAIEAVELIGRRLGVVIVSMVNIFNPEVVVVGGGVIAAGELLLAPARAVVAERVFPFLDETVRIVPARFGVEAGMVGAAALAYDGLAELEERVEAGRTPGGESERPARQRQEATS